MHLRHGSQRRFWTLKSGLAWLGHTAQSCLTLRDPMDCSTPGFPVHHQFPICVNGEKMKVFLKSVLEAWPGECRQFALQLPQPPQRSSFSLGTITSWFSSSAHTQRRGDPQRMGQYSSPGVLVKINNEGRYVSYFMIPWLKWLFKITEQLMVLPVIRWFLQCS